MHSECGIYTINGNPYCQQSGTEKVFSVGSEIMSHRQQPLPISCTKSDKQTFLCHLPVTWKGKVFLSVDLLIAIIVVTLIVLIEMDVFPQPRYGFYCKDPSITYKFEGDTVTMGMLIVLIFLIPLMTVALVEVKENKKLPGETSRIIWRWYKQFLLGFNITLLITEFSKLIIGEPRPHFLDSCKPDTAVNCTEGYITHFTCTNTQLSKWFVSDSSRSFPSGHASLSVFTATFCIWFLYRRLSQLPCQLMKPLLQTLFVIFCLACSLTRITDHRHHWWDVLAGSVLGFMCGIYTVTVFCRNFNLHSLNQPRPSHSTCTLLTDTTNKNATSVVL